MKLKDIVLIPVTIIASILFVNCSVSDDEFVDRLFADYNGENIPGAAVMIIRNGQTIIEKTYGMADVKNRIPVSSATNFRLASVSKQFTAMSIMILKERGLLDYSNTLKDIFPEFPEYGQSITIEYLLQHRSGLIDYESLIPEADTIQVHDQNVLKMMMQVDNTYFVPGSAYQYSNTGYALLAMIVENLSGKRYADFLYDEIFIPLGMENTVAYEKGISEVKNRTYGYHVENGTIEFSDQSVTSAVLGDGGIYTSLDDLYKWDQSLYTEKLISKESLKQAYTPALDHYGFGWRIEEYKGHYCVYHGGSTCGFRNVIRRFPDDGFTVIILTNRREPEVLTLDQKLVDRFLIR